MVCDFLFVSLALDLSQCSSNPKQSRVLGDFYAFCSSTVRKTRLYEATKSSCNY